MPRNLFAVCQDITIARWTVCEARALLHDRQSMIHFVCVEREMGGSDLHPLRVDQISDFVRFIQRTHRLDSTKSIVVCVGQSCKSSLTTAALLIGGFMILGRGLKLEDVVSSFRPIQDSFVNFRDESDNSRFSLRDCWTALAEAKSRGWIDLSNQIRPHMDCLDFGSLDIEAYAHYAKTANGSIFPVVPGKIVMFPSPVNLPDDAEWMDSVDGTQRHFSAKYYADLLMSDFKVTVVACVDSGKDDFPAFAERGLDVEDLPLDGSCPGLLRAMDRLLTVTDGTCGAVALHSGADSVGWRAGALVAAYLVRRLGFPPDAAIAWIRMVDPALLVGRGEADHDVLEWADADPLSRCASFACSAPIPPSPTARDGPAGLSVRLERAKSWSTMSGSAVWTAAPRRNSLAE
jgi:hypothetical protein